MGKPPRSLFVACDFLDPVARLLLPDLRSRVAGLDEPWDVNLSFADERKGSIWSQVVAQGIRDADALLAIVDPPNVNVGFEVGYALGLGKPVRLAVLRAEVPARVKESSLGGDSIDPANAPSRLAQLVSGAWAPPPQPPAGGTQTLLVPPRCRMQAAITEIVEREGRSYVRTPTGWKDGWGEIQRLPAMLEGCGRVLLVLTPPDPTVDGPRDGVPNMEAAILGGYAKALGLDVQVWRHADLRVLADLREKPFPTWRDLPSFQRLLDDALATTLPGPNLLVTFRARQAGLHRHPLRVVEGLGAKTIDHVYVPLRARVDDLAEGRDDLLRSGQLGPRDLLAGFDGSTRWVLLGAPGSGKSTILRRLCAETGEDEHGPFGIYVSLARYAKYPSYKDPFDALRVDGEPDPAAELLRQRAKERGSDVWFLLDGLDEVRSDRVDELLSRLARNLKHEYPRCPVLLTCRDSGYSAELLEKKGLDLRVAHLERLPTRDAKQLIGRWVGTTRLDEVWRRIEQSPVLLDMMGNPLLCTLVAQLESDARDGGRAPEEESVAPLTRRTIYERAVDAMLASAWRDYPEQGVERAEPVRAAELAREVLALLALRLLESGEEAWSVGELEDGVRATRADLSDEERVAFDAAWPNGEAEFLEDAGRARGLLAPHKGAEEDWQFLHRSFGEYLAALGLRSRLHRRLESAAEIKTRVERVAEDPEQRGRWIETFAWLVSFADTWNECLILLERIAAGSRELAVRTVVQAEGVAVLGAIQFVFDTADPDAEALLLLLRAWRRRGSVGIDVPGCLAMLAPQADTEEGLEKVARLHYAWEESGWPVDDDFFARCGLPERPELSACGWMPIPPDGGESSTFEMGGELFDGEQDPQGRDVEYPRHGVRLSPFELGATTVTEEEYARIAPWRRAGASGRRGTKTRGKKGSLPVTEVSWYQARLYCRWLGGRLPTEAEWEFACRGPEGRETRYWSGSEESDLARVGWYRGNSDGLHPAHEEPESSSGHPWGLKNLHGNVWEWVNDWIAPYPETSADHALADPPGPEEGVGRVLRGGGFWNDAAGCRSASRVWNRPAVRFGDVGLRVARSAPQPRSSMEDRS